ncbi:F0F1 ATP synthase subunit B [Myxacorys almedinensis]|uniref:ATP synthase subunit b n=1 Tax=Myxacorys almedinensis A TaxID=2690445 RepID=A0A8J8CI09_9CYAN|nr:F0F1 ATP synthase subunit B [Myxacorys almedinensis]NDJ15996.1 F0F1 ATP synthase subunit B [Myxacorys almedinensis A]
MDIFVRLVAGASFLAETAEAEGGGFGLNFNILETNLINLGIAIAIVVYFGRSFLTKILGERRAAIEAAIQEAETRKKAAAASLAEQQQKLAQAQTEAAAIQSSAHAAADKMKAEILDKGEQDVRRMRESAAQDLDSEQERVINELRQRIAALALQKAEGDLPGRLDNGVQQRLVDRSIALLGEG